MPSELIAKTQDLAFASRGHVLGVMFPKSKATAYPAVVALCKGADQYSESTSEGLLYHFASFGKNVEQITRALAVVNYVGAITAARFFSNGFPLVDTHYLHESLKCYIQAISCDDQAAHCHRVISDTRIGPDAYLFPCNYLIKRQARLDLTPAHPSSLRDQIQAMGVDHGCAWCPNFKPDDFRKL